MVDYSNTPPVMQMKVGANNTTTYLVSLIEGQVRTMTNTRQIVYIMILIPHSRISRSPLQPIPSIFFLTSTQSESPPLLILTFLQQVRISRTRS